MIQTIIIISLVLLSFIVDAFQQVTSSSASMRSDHYSNQIQRQNHQSVIQLNSVKFKQQLGEFESLGVSSDERIVKVYDLASLDPIQFNVMWSIQKEIVGRHVERLKVEFQKKIPKSQFWTKVVGDNLENDTFEDCEVLSNIERDEIRNIFDVCTGQDSIIMLQHEPVYTLGTGSDTNFIKSAGDIDIHRIERGGEVTYHGPGQLTVYPILDLRGYKQDIHWYMRALEEAILISLERAGVDGAVREDDVTGVWVNGKKIAALGVKVKRWVTMHGLAINIDKRSIHNFDGIVPCGLEGREVCCVNDFLDEPITVDEFTKHLKAALQEVFEIKLM